MGQSSVINHILFPSIIIMNERFKISAQDCLQQTVYLMPLVHTQLILCGRSRFYVKRNTALLADERLCEKR